MDTALKARMDKAWQESQAWITAFSGAPHLALLVDVPPEKVQPALASLAGQAENFRITSIPAGKLDETQFITLEAFPENLALLQAGKLAELSVSYAVRLPAFDLDIHILFYALENGNVSLELDWWSDQVFSAETDNYAQFAALMDYFLALQKLFAAPSLYISPESGKDPDEGADDWVEV